MRIQAGLEIRNENLSAPEPTPSGGERFEGKVNPYLPSEAYKSIISNNPNGFKVYKTK